MNWSTKSAIIVISLPVFTVCAGLLYYLYRKEENWDDLTFGPNRRRVAEVKVPIDKVAALIGKSGDRIKDIQDKTDTKILFKPGDFGEKYKVCQIRGTDEAVSSAEKVIHDFLVNQPEILTTEIWVPHTACGRIIGRCGETVKQISEQSNARVIVERYTPDRGYGSEREVIIKGTAQEIALATTLIKAKVAEDNSSRMMVSSRPPRFSTPVKQKAKKLEVVPEQEHLDSIPLDTMSEVYVSSVANPSNFWVQLVGPRSSELDMLIEEMTEYYSKDNNRELHKLEKVEVGQIVAATCPTDRSWYRVKVEGYEDSETGLVVDVYYVDYGDSLYLKLDELAELRTDFLSLRFQAIECRLANYKPLGDTEWSEDAISFFEDIVFTAQWKCVMLKMVGFEKTSEGKNGLPLVDIFNPTLGLNVGEEMMKKGFAEKCVGTVESEPAQELNGSQEEAKKSSGEKDIFRTKDMKNVPKTDLTADFVSHEASLNNSSNNISSHENNETNLNALF